MIEHKDYPHNPEELLYYLHLNAEKWWSVPAFRRNKLFRTIRIANPWNGWPYAMGQIFVAVFDPLIKISEHCNVHPCDCKKCSSA